MNEPQKMAENRKPSPSMIVALIALFVALSGGAFAAGVMIGGSE